MENTSPNGPPPAPPVPVPPAPPVSWSNALSMTLVKAVLVSWFDLPWWWWWLWWLAALSPTCPLGLFLASPFLAGSPPFSSPTSNFSPSKEERR